MNKRSSLQKKLTQTLLSLTLVVPLLGPVSSPSPAFATPSTISVIIDGKLQSYDQPPILINNRLMVPMRSIFEALGATVEWDAERRTVWATRNGVTFEATIGDPWVHINGNAIATEHAPTIHNERTLMPLRLVSELFEADVTWDGKQQTVHVRSTDKMRFFDALYNQDLEHIKAMLQRGIDPDTRAFGNTALEFAITQGKWESVKTLLANGADKDGNVLTSLVLHPPKIESVKFYLQHANPQDPSFPLAELNLLASIIFHGNPVLVKAFLEAKVDPNAKQALDSRSDSQIPEYDALTPLGNALHLESGNLELIEYLLQAGADPNLMSTPDFSKSTSLHHATQESLNPLLHLLVRYGANVNTQDDQGWTPLMIAADRGNAEAVTTLLTAKADPNLTNKQGATALMIAEAHGNTETAKLLADAGAARTKNLPKSPGLFHNYDGLMQNVTVDWTPLEKAAMLGHTAQVNALLAKGTDIGMAFDRAIYGHNFETIRAFFTAKQPLTADQIDKALHAAVVTKNHDLALLALERGANPNRTYEDRDSYLSFAVALNDLQMIELLLEHGTGITPSHSGSPFQKAVERGHLQAMNLLVEHFADDDTKASELNEGLSSALYLQDMTMVQRLLELGADPNAVYKDQTTPLQLAKATGFPEFVTVLKAAGALE